MATDTIPDPRHLGIRASLLLPRAEDRQWEPAPIPRPAVDTSERSKGERPSDPTADIAADPRRLAVREGYTGLVAALKALGLAIDTLESAIERWDGDR